MTVIRLTGAVCVAALSLTGCEKRDCKQEHLVQRTVQLPTAIEVFNLRSKCAELGQKILDGNTIGSALTQEQVSHYNPKTNRCYVELDVHTADLTKPWTVDDRFLFDGQTSELLMFAKNDNGVKTGLGGNTPNSTPYGSAMDAIGAAMADDRSQ
jgi:hypothetical protein